MISIIMPGIRVYRWEEVYNHICQSTTKPFELILVSPYELPSSLKNAPNVKHVMDFGSPVRCSNIGLSLCEGELVTWQADDGDFLPEMLDKAIDAFEAMPANPKNVLILKYMEGGMFEKPDSYFKLVNAYPLVKPVTDNPEWWIFNFAIMRTEYLRELGGWCSQFETSAFSHADFAIRAQQDGCITQIFPQSIVFNHHGQNDHAPIEAGHNYNDYPLYCSLHNDPNMVKRKVDIDNWKVAPTIWKRRFPCL